VATVFIHTELQRLSRIPTAACVRLNWHISYAGVRGKRCLVGGGEGLGCYASNEAAGRRTCPRKAGGRTEKRGRVRGSPLACGRGLREDGRHPLVEIGGSESWLLAPFCLRGSTTHPVVTTIFLSVDSQSTPRIRGGLCP
jgi:hypothetical protein